MKLYRGHARPSRQRQNGVALIAALLLLAVMLTFGTVSMESALTEQRIAAQLHDLNQAFEAAESTSNEALYQLRNLTADGKAQPENKTGYYIMGSKGSTAQKLNIKGLSTVSNNFWSSANFNDTNSFSPEKVVFRSTSKESKKTAPNRYVIERIQDSQEGEPVSQSNYFMTYSRVSTRGTGYIDSSSEMQSVLTAANRQTAVTIQNYFIEIPE